MKVTVKDCLALEVFKDARLVVGAKNAENRVKAVSVLETTNVDEVKARFAHEGELILSGYLTKEAIKKVAKDRNMKTGEVYNIYHQIK